jgi:acetylornithine deacetylase/succinyl-diaminopimelate desuccinylase-like protein
MFRPACALLIVLSIPAFAAQDTYTVAAPPPPGFDRARAQRDTRSHLERLLALDTQNPPGREILAANYLEEALRPIAGIETRVLDPGDGRANFVARLRAVRASKRPVLVMGHLDVVGVDLSKWTSPPFQATERDGYLYGRGAIDDKGMLAATVAAVHQLAARRDTLDRDVIVLGTAAEEGGDQGVDRIVQKHFDLIRDAEFALNEGGRVRIANNSIRAINIQITEKISYVVRATARGTGGHASVPLPDNPLAALSRALARIHESKPPVRVSVTTREYFRRLAPLQEDAAMRHAMETIATARDQTTIERAAEVLSREPLHSAVVRTGVSITLMSGGIRSNVIPSEATATVNVRVLPEGNIRADVAEMNRIGGESAVTFELVGEPQTAPPVSPTATPLFQAMEAAGRAMAPGAVVIPFMSTGATDGAVLRAHGIPTYGILPLPLVLEDELRMHGDNERVPIAALGWAAEYIYRVLQSVSSRQ